MPSLDALPTEVVLDIVKRLPLLAKLRLSSTSRRFYALLQPPLTRDEKLEVLCSLERVLGIYPTGVAICLYRACGDCLRLLPFFHFATSRSSLPSTPAHALRCLGCWITPPSTARSIAWVDSQLRMCPQCRVLMIWRPDAPMPKHWDVRGKRRAQARLDSLAQMIAALDAVCAGPDRDALVNGILTVVNRMRPDRGIHGVVIEELEALIRAAALDRPRHSLGLLSRGLAAVKCNVM